MLSDIKQIKALVFFALMSAGKDSLEKYSQLYSSSIDANILCTSRIIDFTRLSRYYNREMGDVIHKQLFLTSRVIDCHNVGHYKNLSNKLEHENQAGLIRVFNIDPGYINLSQIVLVSTKFSPHRIPVDKELWAETTLIRFNKKWQPLLWTYRDYLSEEFLSFFNQIRSIIRDRLKDEA